MYTPPVALSVSDEEEFAVVIPQLPLDIGTPVLEPDMRRLRHVVGLALRNITWDIKQIRKSSISDKIRHSSVGSIDEGTTTALSPNGETPENSRNRRSRRLTRDATQMMFNPIVQQALHDLNSERLIDSIFALYIPGRTKPVYISEVVNGSTNPEFTEINISNLSDAIRNKSMFAVSIWGKIDGCDDSTKPPIKSAIKWKKIFSELIDLSSMVFVGKSVDTISMSFPLNSIIIYLSDGCYILPKVQALNNENQKKLAKSSQFGSNFNSGGFPVSTISFDSIMKINNLEECIKDSEMTIKSVSESIDLKLQPPESNLFILEKKQSELNQKFYRIKTQIDCENLRHNNVLQQIEDQKKKLAVRRQKLKQEKDSQQIIKQFLSKESIALSNKKQIIQTSIQLTIIELARIATCLQEIFPIDRGPNDNDKRGEFSFTICGLDLPDATAAATNTNLYDEDEIAAAYGLITQLVHTLSCYIGVPLRYPVQTYGSQSFIIDPISAIQGSRTFPLWTKGSIFYRFEYGVYLFHKDIEQLVNSVSLPVVDLRHTLANIKNLLLVLSSPGNNIKNIAF